jgi:DNA-binding Lrp family transcriptional regulator
VSEIALRLLNEFQRGFPLCERPFREVAAQLGCGEEKVLGLLRAFVEQGVVSRIGAVFAPRTIGASALVALAVPPGRLEPVASLVSSYREVNHNYEREDRYNLWFVVAAERDEALRRVLHDIEAASGCGPALVLPLVDEYRIDLGFDLCDTATDTCQPLLAACPERVELAAPERNLLSALQEGLPLVPRPYLALAQQAGLGEQAVQALLERWIGQGTIRRFGVIVRHRELGYHANAMLVWDVPDVLVSALGLRLAQQPGVNLCYRRERALPAWPFNLYCMLHGRSRDAVLARVEVLRQGCDLAAFPSCVLFSRRRFKQQGARYVQPEAAHG